MIDLPALIRERLPLGTTHLLEILAAEGERMGVEVYIVGGFVRDLLWGTPKLDLDILIVGDAHAFGDSFAARFDGQWHKHIPFGTGRWLPGKETPQRTGIPRSELPLFFDFVMARRETYSRPAALPTVEGGSLADDLFRRDFTINTLAMRLSPPPFGALSDPHGGLADFRAKVIRVLHDRSFIDDPTRLFRAARFMVRLDFTLEPHTAGLIPPALSVVNALTSARIRHELDLIFQEAFPERVMHILNQWGVLGNLHKGLVFHEEMANHFAQAREFVKDPPAGMSPPPLAALLWALWGRFVADPAAFAARLALDRQTTQLLMAVHKAVTLFPALDEAALTPSAVVALIESVKEGVSETLYAAMLLLSPTPLVKRHVVCYATQWRFTYAHLTGDDLLAMGVPRGQQIGVYLQRLRTARLDGLLKSTDDAPQATEERTLVRQWLAEEKTDQS